MPRVPILRSVRRFCLACQGGSARAVRACADEGCPLRDWRLPVEKAADAEAAPAAQAASAGQSVPAGQDILLAQASSVLISQQGTELSAAGGASAPAASAARTCAAAETAVVGELSPRARAALRAVRRQCLLCAGSRQDVRACRAREECPLWSYRFGVRPETYKAVRQRFFAPRPLTLFT